MKIYLTRVRNFITKLHEDFFSNNLADEESFRMLTSYVLLQDKGQHLNV